MSSSWNLPRGRGGPRPTFLQRRRAERLCHKPARAAGAAPLASSQTGMRPWQEPTGTTGPTGPTLQPFLRSTRSSRGPPANVGCCSTRPRPGTSFVATIDFTFDITEPLSLPLSLSTRIASIASCTTTISAYSYTLDIISDPVQHLGGSQGAARQTYFVFAALTQSRLVLPTISLPRKPLSLHSQLCTAHVVSAGNYSSVRWRDTIDDLLSCPPRIDISTATLSFRGRPHVDLEKHHPRIIPVPTRRATYFDPIAHDRTFSSLSLCDRE